MARLDQSFDVADLPEGRGEYEPLPEGWYNAEVADAEVRQTKDGTGQYIRIRYSITGPVKAGRVVFGNINVVNKSQKAEEIGRQQLGDLMRCIGLPRLEDSDQLIGAQMQIKLTIRPAENGYSAQNEVRGFKPGEGSAPVAAAAAPAKSSPPWAKK